jgi:DNA-directed RNA polymerase sigma subunit (sigma70/sigma32)
LPFQLMQHGGSISDQSREVRIPRYLVEKIVKVNKVERELKALLNRDPSEEEIAIEAEITLGKLKQIRAIAFRFLNLDQPINGNDPESRILGEVLPNEEWEKEFTQAAARSDLRELFAEQVIDEREANILKERFLSPEEPTLTDLSEQLGISRERVRQIERRALNRLRVCDPTL